jgi:hypothetical protein
MENLQVQRKKMSLANIEGRLSLEEMENVMAGSMGRNCMLMGAGVVILGGAAVIATGGWALLFAGGAISGFYSGASSNCF